MYEFYDFSDSLEKYHKIDTMYLRFENSGIMIAHTKYTQCIALCLLKKNQRNGFFISLTLVTLMKGRNWYVIANLLSFVTHNVRNLTR